MVGTLVKGLILHGQIQTTLARAREAQRLADRLVSLGKEGSIHARRRAFRILQDRTLVSQLFTDIAPRFGDVPGGYTRVMRLSFRRGDGAQRAVLAFSKLPAVKPAAASPRASQTPKPATTPQGEQPAQETEKSKGLLEGLRGLWTKKKKGAT